MFEIPPGGSHALECYVRTIVPGTFTGEVHVFLDDAGLRQYDLRVDGEAAGKKDK